MEVRRRGRGSHRKWVTPQTNRRTTIPDWSAKDLKLGAVRNLGLDWREFNSEGG